MIGALGSPTGTAIRICRLPGSARWRFRFASSVERVVNTTSAPSKNISRKGPRNCRSLGFARDDKGKGDGSIKSGCWTEAFFITLGGPQAHGYSCKRNCYSSVLQQLAPGYGKAPYRAARVAAIRYGASAFRLDNEILKRLRSTYSRAGRESSPAFIEVAITVTGPGLLQPSSGALPAHSAASCAPVSNKSVCRSPDKPYRFAAPA